MKKITRSAILPYSCLEMFKIVNDVENYPDFLPWCSGSKIINSEPNLLIAKIDIGKAGINQSFTTSNILFESNLIEIKLVDGPFSHLEGTWQFITLDEDCCKIILNLEYEVSNKLFNFALSAIFEQIASTLVDSFCKRAKNIL
jgi:ribosome-associated toxin RatA of RatAB toxin-antitoxin module